ncbi:MAG: GNAT family N-acetyltransferase [Planctomycetes bacterium]|nr:GNAT family N-acetyltransferase [Planctomycetota bacterium]
MLISKPATDRELRRSLQRLVYHPELSRTDIDRQVEALINHAKRRGLSLEHCLVASEEGEILHCCLCIDSPGRSSAVYLPTWVPDVDAAAALISLVQKAADEAHGRNICFLQAIISPNATFEQEIYQQAGFERLAELIYMERDLLEPLTGEKPSPPLTWITYSAESHQLFARTVLETYEDSLDCVGISGLRQIEDILATHRSTGVFNPRTWFVGISDDNPIGVLLLSAVPEQAALEVVYMGLRPACRGKGYASAFMEHGIRTARDLAALRLTLAVDAENAPARRLYARFAFEETARRCAWVRILRSDVARAGACGVAGP